MMQLSVRLVPVDDTTLVIALTGELDSTTKPVLAAFLDPLPQTSVKHVLVAAGDLWFCDLNGLDLLATTHRALQEKSGYLALAEVQPSLRRLIALMTEQSLTAIPVFASMPEALAAAGVEAYQVPTPATGRRHLPRLRAVPRATATRAQSAERGRSAKRGQSPWRARSAEQSQDRPRVKPAPEPKPARPRTPPITLDASRLPTVISQARSLRDQALHQQEALHDRLTATAQARERLLTIRRRCDDSLVAMRSSLSEARSIMTLTETGSVPPHFS
ncbi:STAS domain-containing protein [Nonomuraea sp. PA05]|uniref:STAS domain-containing protein n=1 Tax=Nonomuraea sp. PA05 TaxID=2604466 RepID=UPI0016527820|nr:STAS domain-containing protein [Nonomuraea sp. PA05]